MLRAQLCFLSNEYYQDFPDDKLMQNKDTIVPISSKYEKYKRIEQGKIKKYGRCNTIRFGTVVGRNTAFLIQNMCPATEKYLTPYIDKNKQPIRIDGRVAADVEKNARSVLALAKRGAKVIFPDVFTIFQGLEQQLQQAKEELSALSAELEQTEHTVKQYTDHGKNIDER